MSDLKFDRDIQIILSRLRDLPKDYDKERKSLLKKAAKPVVKALKSSAIFKGEPKPHDRYHNGRKVATYYPGNLKRSIRTLKFRRSKDLFVGPKLGKKGSTGTFKGNKVDGYYGHMVEFGTVHSKAQPFMRPGFAKSKGRAQQIIRSGAERILRRYAARYRAT